MLINADRCGLDHPFESALVSHTDTSPRKTLLIISQVYVPDPAAVGQHMHDAAAEMVRRGYRVIVYTANRGYHDPAKRHDRFELRDGVTVHRLPLSSFGKGSIIIRLLGGVLFLLQAFLRSLFVRDLDGVLVRTSPPMASAAAIMLRWFRRVPFVFWAMDINPDQMIAMNRIGPRSLPARMFERLMRGTLRRAAHVVALDEFMAARLQGKADLDDRLSIIPPWPHEDHLKPLAHEGNPFRDEQGLKNKFVIMYSGNLSPAHPVRTILRAVRQLRDEMPRSQTDCPSLSCCSWVRGLPKRRSRTLSSVKA